MGREAIVDCRATSKEIFPSRQRKIGPAASNYVKILTDGKADLTWCPFSLNHYKPHDGGANDPELLVVTNKDWKQRQAQREQPPPRGRIPAAPVIPGANGASLADKAWASAVHATRADGRTCVWANQNGPRL